MSPELLVGPAPDLIETAVGNPPATLVLGQSFSETDTVKNQGSGAAGASYTKYFLSASGNTPQYLLGDRAVGGLGSGATDSGGGTVQVQQNGIPGGSYHVVACADSGSGTAGRISQVTESDETNNCSSSSGTTTVTGPDLTESNVSVSPSTINATTGTLTVSDQVNNIGGASAAASTTRWYLSTDTVKDASDAFIRNCVTGGPVPGRSVGTISAGGNSAGSASTSPLCIRDATGLHQPANGTYYVIACADDATRVGELNELNNCTASSNTLTVTGGGADLLVTTLSDPPTSGAVGTTFNISDTTANQGGVAASSTFTKFYLSTNGTTLNVWLNTRSVPALNPGTSNSATTSMQIQSGTPSGVYKIVACADSGPGTAGRTSQVAESNESNNCRASAGSISIGSPDLIITAINNPPGTGSVGTTWTVNDTTKNQGLTDVTISFYNKYYLSTDGRTPVYLLAPGALANPLAAGASEPVSATAKVPSGTAPGAYWVLGCTDAGPGTSGKFSQVTESDETNNCTKSGSQITIN